MNAFEIYLMFKANDIQAAFGVIGVLGGISLLILAIMYGFAVNSEQSEESVTLLKTYLKFVIAVLIPSVLIATFIPSTQTMAAMYILPKLTSPEAIKIYKEEGGELYTLTKQALQSLIKPKQDADNNK
jgi:hypothetical protein